MNSHFENKNRVQHLAGIPSTKAYDFKAGRESDDLLPLQHFGHCYIQTYYRLKKKTVQLKSRCYLG